MAKYPPAYYKDRDKFLNKDPRWNSDKPYDVRDQIEGLKLLAQSHGIDPWNDFAKTEIENHERANSSSPLNRQSSFRFAYDHIIKLDNNERIRRRAMHFAQVLQHKQNIDHNLTIQQTAWALESAWCNDAMRMTANSNLTIEDVLDENGQPLPIPPTHRYP